MTPIHKRAGDARFTAAIGAVLFLACSAYFADALFTGARRAAVCVEATRAAVVDSVRLEGIAIRTECAVQSGGALGAEPRRCPAALLRETLSDGSLPAALWLPDSDGYEYLTPELLAELNVPELRRILSLRPESVSRGGRLVLEDAWYFAALADADGGAYEPGTYRLRFDGESEAGEALLVSASEACGGKRALVFRLCRDGCGSLRRASAELILSEHSGLLLPAAALGEDADGTYVRTLSAAGIKRRQTEIIWSDGEQALAALSGSADALREGEPVLLPDDTNTER